MLQHNTQSVKFRFDVNNENCCTFCEWMNEWINREEERKQAKRIQSPYVQWHLIRECICMFYVFLLIFSLVLFVCRGVYYSFPFAIAMLMYNYLPISILPFPFHCPPLLVERKTRNHKGWSGNLVTWSGNLKQELDFRSEFLDLEECFRILFYWKTSPPKLERRVIEWLAIILHILALADIFTYLRVLR